MSRCKKAVPIVLVALLACGGSAAPSSTDDAGEQAADLTRAPFVSLTATPATIQAGQTSALLPEFRGLGFLSPGIGLVRSGRPVTVKPARTTSYTLTVWYLGRFHRQSATVTVIVPPAPVVVIVSPVTVTLPAGGTQAFLAKVSGSTDTRVTWSVRESGGGTIDANGSYLAPDAAGTYHVVATSVASAASSGAAEVTVTAKPAPPPEIQSFTGTPSSIAPGGSATLSATYSGGEGSIDQGVGPIASGASVSVAPATTTTYTLTVTGDAGATVTGAVTVSVTSPPPPPPAIQGFAANPSSITAGGSATLSATYSGGTGSIDQGVGPISSGGTVSVSPAATTTYTLTVSDGAGHSVTASATVSVTTPPPPIAVSVSPSAAAVQAGGTQGFTATVSNTTDTRVTWSVQESGGGTIDATGRYLAPAAAGTYHVLATSVADATKSGSATVVVTPPPPAIQGFAANPSSITAGGSATLSATYSGGTGSIDQGVGPISSGGTVSVSPAATTTYTLTVSDGAGHSVTASATVTVTTPPPPIAVSVSPSAATVQAGGTQLFTATVSNATDTSVTWSVQESGGGTIDAGGTYVAPAGAGTCHVVATSVADPTKSGSATVTVTVPQIEVSVSPSVAQTTPGGAVAFTATVTGASGGMSTAVTWSVMEGPTGGSIDGQGSYTAPSVEGTFHVVATSVADPSKSAGATVNVASVSFIPADRLTTWNPGVTGGIPVRTTVCATVDASTYDNGASDAAAGIQAAIDACPAGQVVQLSAGTFTIDGGRFLLIKKGITLRGAGPGQTTLQKTDGAKPGQEATGPNPSPLVIVGPARWGNNPHGVKGSTNLTADAVKGATSITVASTTGFSAGQTVLLDELSGAIWQADPAGRGQIWASPDWRVVWQRHNPSQGTDDPFPDAAGWFSRSDRPTNEVKQIDHVSGNTVFFTSPIHITYRTSQTAQLSFYEYATTRDAGVEDLKLIGGDNGNLRFQWAANCWAKGIDNTVWHDEGFSVEDSFRVEIRDSYVHDAAWAQPGGAGYAISLASGSAEVLVENSIILKANKVMVARCAGAGSVFGYNYADDGYINTNTGWIEVGLNASHMVGPHHVLFEGNYGFNWDSDKTHGNAIYHTVFRNHLRGVRRDFGDTVQSGHGPLRCAGAAYYSYWHSFVGNVLGAQGQMTGWTYQSGNMDVPSIWLLGWDDWSPYPTDAKVASTVLRHGNFDYLTNSVQWDPAISDHTLPASLYLARKPTFFDAGSGYVWPWVEPDGAQKLYTLPAKARFDAGTPFVQP